MPRYLTTLAAAEQLYDALYQWKQLGSICIPWVAAHISVFGITSNSNGSSSFLTTVHRIDLRLLFLTSPTMAEPVSMPIRCLPRSETSTPRLLAIASLAGLSQRLGKCAALHQCAVLCSNGEERGALNLANNGRTGLDANSVLTSIGNFDPKAPCDDVTFQPYGLPPI
jgi:hypothetical protein